ATQQKAQNSAACSCGGSGPCHCGCPESAPPAETPRPPTARLCRCDDAPGTISQVRNCIEKSRTASYHFDATERVQAIVSLCTLDPSAWDVGPPDTVTALRTVVL